MTVCTCAVPMTEWPRYPTSLLWCAGLIGVGVVLFVIEFLHQRVQKIIRQLSRLLFLNVMHGCSPEL